MNIFQKAFAAMRHTARPPFFSGLLRRTRFDYRREVGDGLDSSVVTAPIQWIQRALPEATLQVKRRGKDGKLDALDTHPMLDLIQAPNPHYDDIALWGATLFSLLFDGNGYWLKVRNGAGRPAELWYVPHWTMEPKWPQDGSQFISHYRYTPGGGSEAIRLDPEDVVHFRLGLNPRNTRLGLAPLDGALREIFMDLESSNFVASLLRNMGVPGVVISPKGGALPAPADVEATKAWFQEAFGGDKRGGPLVIGAPTDVSPYGFNPQQMNMGEARDIAEERVCACLGIPAAVVGFGAGLQQTKVGATMEELRKLAWHNGVLPVCRTLAGEIKRSLLPDFGPMTGLDLGWDTSEVLALREDEDKETERWGKRLAGGGITVFEYRDALGMDADDSHRIYLRSIATIEVPEGAPPRAISVDPATGKERTGTKAARASGDAYKRGAAYALLLQRQAPGLEKNFAKRLITLFTGFGKAVGEAAAPLLAADPSLPKGAKAALRPSTRSGPQGDRGEKADEALVAQILQKLGIAEWRRQLRETYESQYLETGKAVASVAERAGIGTGLPDPVARSIVAAGGRRSELVDIEGQTRDALYQALAEGRAAGEGAQALADRIVEHSEGGHWQSAETRAQIIARTETKYAQNVSTIETARASGVERFIVFDGRLGAERSTPSHIARDGSIVSAAVASTMADEEHPNGTLSFAPDFEKEE